MPPSVLKHLPKGKSASLCVVFALCVALVAAPLALATPSYVSTYSAVVTGSISTPVALSIDGSGTGYVLGSSQSTMASLSADGTSTTALSFNRFLNGAPTDLVGSGNTLYTSNVGTHVYKFVVSGSSATAVASGSSLSFNFNTSITMARDGTLYANKSTSLYTLSRADLNTLNTQTLSATPYRIRVNASGTLLYYISTAGTVRKVTLSNGVIGTDTSIASISSFVSTQGIALDAGGNVYVAHNGSTVRKYSSGGTLIWTYAPSGAAAFGTIRAMNISGDTMYIINASRLVKAYSITREAPSGVRATPSDDDVLVSWDAVSVPGYVSTTIRRSTVAAPSTVNSGSLVAADVTGTSYLDTDLGRGPYYYYGVFHKYAGDLYSEAGTAATGVEGDANVCAPYAYWPFDALGSPLAEDASGNGFHGSAFAASPSLSTDVPAHTGFTDPYSYSFVRASDQGIQLTRPVQEDMTICAWIKTTAVGSNTDHFRLMPIFESEGGGLDDDFGFGVDSNGKLAYGNGDLIGGVDTIVTSTSAVNTGDWVHACATRDSSSGQMKVYVNGTLEATATGATGALVSNASAYIGDGTDGGVNWQGNIDEVRVYSGVLSAADIGALAGGAACQSISSSSSSQMEERGGGGGGTRRGATERIVKILRERLPAQSQVLPVAHSAAGGPPASSALQARTCARVGKWFGSNENAKNRVNLRLKRWFGFVCS